jgi:NADPH:quinone reductase-like Zn-dependent oxidoreductase
MERGEAMTRIVRVRELGGPEVMRFEDIELGRPGPDEVRVRIEAIGLNRSEAMFRAGRYPVPIELPALLGYEACGIVVEAGADVKGYGIGDRVSILPMFRLGTYGVYGEEAIVPAYALLPAPPGLTAAEAAAVWMQYMTAFALIEVAGAGIGDHIIIRAASSSVGLAAIQLANWAGAVPIAATRTFAKAEALRAQGAAHVITTDDQDIAAETMRITGGKGARIVFDPVGGPEVQKLAEAMGERGVLIIYGGLSEQSTPYPHWECARKGLSLRGWIASEIWNHPVRYARAREAILQGLAEGRLKPVIARTFPLDEIVEAHRYLEANNQVGKVVVTV